jgi:hypothetical protein
VRTVLNWLFRRVVGKLAAIPVRRRLRAFEDATHRPREVQQALLERILTANSGTAFGQDHHFAACSVGACGVAEFRKQVPVAGYEYIEPYIRRVVAGEWQALLSSPKVHMFAMTSGTTAARKLIPVNDQYLADYRRGWNLWGLKTYRDHPAVRLRPIVQMSGDWQETFTPGGIPCGAVTGLTAHMQLPIIRWIYCVPGAIGKVKDAASKYYLTLRLSLPRRVGLIIAANPSTLVSLARAGDQEKEALIRDLYDGTLSPRCEIPDDLRRSLARRVQKRYPKRARELEAIVERSGTLYPKDYWPRDCVIGNWMGGSVGAYLRHYPRYYGATPVRDVGLIASEGRMTIPMADGTPSGLLDISSHYFEFIPQEEAGSPQPTVLEAHELQEGRAYFILLTTAYGLYRYNISDVVRCTGFHNGTPLVEFLNKGANFANLTGEKVSEYHVTGAMADVLRQLDLTLTAYSVAPCWDDDLPYYGLFVERGDLASPEQGAQLTQALERRLTEINVEYGSKRESQRLGPMRLELLPANTWQQWDRERLARTGGTLEQYKHPCLINDPHFRNSIPVEEEIQAPLVG